MESPEHDRDEQLKLPVDAEKTLRALLKVDPNAEPVGEEDEDRE